MEVTISRDAVLEWIKAFAGAIQAHKDWLVALDAAIGDGDHGANMHRGMQAVVAKLPALGDQDIGAVLKAVAMTLISTVGGASGPLYGTLFLQMSTAAAGKRELTLAEGALMWKAGVDGVIQRGKAAAGDKTMLDTLIPAVAALNDAISTGASPSDALSAFQSAAERGMQATIPLVARKGRASYLGERSAGHQDPGATSSCLLIHAAAQTWIPRVPT